MRVKEISIQNLGNIESLVIKPGMLTTIEGQNGAGKSSVLDAIKSTISGGHEPGLIRNGAPFGEVDITLDDGVILRKRITPKQSNLTVIHPKLGKVSKSQQYINQIIDSLSLDPIQFLTAKPADRVNILLEALPMHVTVDQLGFLPVEVLQGKDLGKHALEVLGAIQKDLYDARTGLNRAAKEKQATAKQMSETLPPEAPEGNWGDALNQATDDYRALQKNTQARIKEIESDASSASESQDALFRSKRDAVKDELETAIEKLRADSDIEIARCQKERDEVIQQIKASEKETLEAINNDYQPKFKAVNERLAEAKTMIEQEQKAKSLREFIEQLTAEASELESKSGQITGQLESLTALKTSLLESLPIPGVEISEGQILVNGVPFERVNDAEKYRIAIELGKLRSGDLGLLLIDRAEIFDDTNWAMFKQAAESGNVQIVAARVGKGGLTVSSEPKEAA